MAAHRWWSALGLLFILLGLVSVGSKIQFEEDISKLIPINSENADYQKVLKTANFADKIIVNIQRDETGSVDDLAQYATAFIDSLNTHSGNYLKNIQGQVTDRDISGTLDFVYKNLPLFLDAADYRKIAQKITEDSIAAITKENYKTLISPSGIVVKKTILKDPLGLSLIALGKLQQLGVSDGFILKNGFLMSEDEQHILLFITPVHASNETAENEKFVENLYRLQDQLNDAYIGKVKGDYFGAVLIAAANAQQIKKDIQFTVGIALTLLLLILVFFYKKLTLPVILFTPTIFGGLLSIALLYLLRGKISAISLGIGAVLLGVTLDYSLHILTHIRNGDSIKKLYQEVTSSVLMSSLTTATAFLCLLFLQSQALQDLGIFAAVSVISASVFALLFIPQVYNVSKKQSISKTLLDRIAAHNFHKNKWGLALLGILLLISIFTYNHVAFNKDISKLNYEPQPLIDARLQLESLTDMGSKSIYIAAYGNDREKVLQTNDTLFTVLQQLKNEGSIINFSSVGALVHSQKVQQDKISKWKTFWNTETTASVKNNLVASGESLGFKPNTFSPFFALLNTHFQPLQIDDYKSIKAFSIDDYVTTANGFATVTSLIKTDSTGISAIHNALDKAPQTLVIDRQGMNETFLGTLKNDFNHLIGYSILAILILLLLFYRSFSLTLVTSVPIFLTWFLTLGVMGLMGLQFNIFNIIISTFIFGLGIDYSIFITNGLLMELRTGEKTLSTHKTSIVLSVITTILGVGVLIFAKHPALYSISLVSLIGILSAAFVAFTVQPQLFRLFVGSRYKRPISFRLFVHSVLSFTYYGLGGVVLSVFGVLLRIIPISKKIKMAWFHKSISKLMGSVLYTNPFVKKKIINTHNETFDKPVMIIANHTSFLDILAIGMLHPKIIFLVNDWVYNSPIFGKAVQAAGFYPVSSGLEEGVEHLRKKVAQGYSLITFPEGTRSKTNKIKRFHKGAFFLAEQFQLDILPVLIHGNSEVLPKGTFIIKDGSITLKLLKKISANDSTFGVGYRERTKKIGAHFKDEFQQLRNEIEHETYFYPLVLEDYRYKGDLLHTTVKKDLYQHKSVYKELLDYIPKKAHIAHLSNTQGQFDFLLVLDSNDRRITTYIEDIYNRNIVKNSYITSNYSNLHIVDTIEKALATKAEILIVELDFSQSSMLTSEISNEILILIVLKTIKTRRPENIAPIGFAIVNQNDNFTILKRDKEAQT
ncbi:1-acyl-sn-glycerol-3-phosphate acyltransferase [uncultured Kriegella sp.]|uniref:1-acyl-sn-glycerol-3-phosphate acyltransferase n=1 Tax=uncultured Kriegella sp. TaxID=1798910 RepID=UPI0030DAA267